MDSQNRFVVMGIVPHMLPGEALMQGTLVEQFLSLHFFCNMHLLKHPWYTLISLSVVWESVRLAHVDVVGDHRQSSLGVH